MADLFGKDKEFFEVDENSRPLAERLRPKSLDEIIGQTHLLGQKGSLRRMIAGNHLNSLILWGPTGTGKTTIARLLAHEVDYELVQISAIFSGVADLKKCFEKAKQGRLQGKKTLLFVDEIHRFNRAQQDSFLPVMENGTLVLVGATTQNPSFELNSALLSRAQVLSLKPLNENELEQILKRAEKELGKDLPLDKNARQSLISMADGDARALLNMVEDIFATSIKSEILDAKSLQNLVQRRAPIYDKGQDEHYNLISALHKSVRGSDPDAALYYFTRMIGAGEDPMFLARRLIRMASEDIGLADPNALPQAIAGRDAYQMLGTPEGELSLAQVVIYLALAPKSNAAYVAFKSAKRLAKQTGSPMPPKVILNAPTKLMKDEKYGESYIYDHDTPEGFSGQDYFPEKIGRQKFYTPIERGFERDLKKRLDYFASIRSKNNENR